jgi:hypothetical protein
MTAFIGPLSNCGNQRYAELQAALDMDHSQSDEEVLEQVFQGGFGYGRGFRLMKPEKFTKRPRRSYKVNVGDHIVHVGVKQKCFIIRQSPPPVAGCRNRVNNRGDLTIGFGHGRPIRFPATLAQTRRPWKLVLDVLGIGENDLRIDQPNSHIEGRELEEELFGSSCDEGCDAGSDDGPDPEMPALMEAEVTAGNLTDNQVTATPKPQAMEVSAGSSTDEPGSSYAGAFWAFGEKPVHFQSATSVLQPADTSMHQQVTTVYWPRPLPMTCSHTRMATRLLLNLPISTERFTLYTTAPRAQEAPRCQGTCTACATYTCKGPLGHYGIHNCGSYRCRRIDVQGIVEENF